MLNKIFDVLGSIFKDPKTESLLAIREQQVENLREQLRHERNKQFYYLSILIFVSVVAVLALIAAAEALIH